jgi:hypothetical protein
MDLQILRKLEKWPPEKLLLPQANGCACVDFPMQLMGCFGMHPSTYWVSSQNMNVG